jgi:hypothetical protein
MTTEQSVSNQQPNIKNVGQGSTNLEHNFYQEASWNVETKIWRMTSKFVLEKLFVME